MTSRKGITPVIAVVLLLLITVGAVASAWGLYQQITSDQSNVNELNEQQRASNTDISFESAWNPGDGDVNITLRNTGSVPVNLTRDVELTYRPVGENEFYTETVYENQFGGSDSPWDSDCISGDGRVLGTSGSTQELVCDMRVSFPSAGQTSAFRFSYLGQEVTPWQFECSVDSTDTTFCHQ